MTRRHGLFANALFEAIFIGGPLWLINHFFGPFHVPEQWKMVFYAGLGVVGLAVFVGIAVSRHPEAWKVRAFGAVVLGVFAAEALYIFVARRG